MSGQAKKDSKLSLMDCDLPFKCFRIMHRLKCPQSQHPETTSGTPRFADHGIVGIGVRKGQKSTSSSLLLLLLLLLHHKNPF